MPESGEGRLLAFQAALDGTLGHLQLGTAGYRGVIVVAWMAYDKAHHVLLPLAVVVIVGLLLEPLVEFLVRHRFPRWPAVLLTTILMIVALGGILAIVIYGIATRAGAILAVPVTAVALKATALLKRVREEELLMAENAAVYEPFG